MRKLFIAGVALTAVLTATLIARAGNDMDARIKASRTVIKAFAGSLQAELKGAMKASGPLGAIQACNGKAPVIAAEQSTQTGWDVGRTSLKYRNPENAPDEWESAVMQSFEARRAAGEDPAKLDYAEYVNQDGKRVFRYMKAIPTGEVCLNCHGGDSVKPDVEAELAHLYPGDKARGFRVGDIRGAFTIIQPAE